MDTCQFCWPQIEEEAIFESEHHVFVKTPGSVLLGSGMIIPKAHKETVFNLSEEEWLDAFEMLNIVRAYLDESLNPDGYNIGWNCYPVGGQTVGHVHMHVIPRFKDEPLAGKGIRHHLKQEINMRPKGRSL